MRKLNQTGSLVLPLIIVIVLLLGTAAFAVWAFAGRQDYKNNSDDKVTAAVTAATTTEASKKDAEFAATEKSPFRT